MSHHFYGPYQIFSLILIYFAWIFPAPKHFSAVLSECSFRSSRVCPVLSIPKDEIDESPFHREAKRPRAEKPFQLSRTAKSKVAKGGGDEGVVGEAEQSVSRAAWVLHYKNAVSGIGRETGYRHEKVGHLLEHSRSEECEM